LLEIFLNDISVLPYMTSLPPSLETFLPKSPFFITLRTREGKMETRDGLAAERKNKGKSPEYTSQSDSRRLSFK
jgi:hypothetical protein